VNVHSTQSNEDSEAGIVVLTLARPPVNALDPELMEEIAGAVAGLREQDDCRALVIKGSERIFSAGADLRAVRKLLADNGVDAVSAFVARMQAVFADIEALPFPTLAAIRGAAAGGGLELALACDVRIAADDAKLGLPEIRHGLLPGAGGTQRMTRLAGRGVAARLMLTGDLVSGADAERLGLVESSVPSNTVDATALELAGRMAAQPVAAGAIKAAIRLAAQAGDAGFDHEISASRELYATEGVQQKLADF
jgi:enoyl-CoA hydratase/carnithine racemase